MAVTVPAALPTVTGLLLARAGDPEPGLRFEDRRWSWREHVGECARYAAALRARRVPGRPFHVGVLADNVPVWWRPDGRSPGYVPLGQDEAAALDAGIRGVR
jgi:hypothetical protein